MKVWFSLLNLKKSSKNIRPIEGGIKYQIEKVVRAGKRMRKEKHEIKLLVDGSIYEDDKKVGNLIKGSYGSALLAEVEDTKMELLKTLKGKVWDEIKV